MIPINMTETNENTLFCHVSGLLQVWNYMESFSFLGRPRPWHGFMYVRCSKVVFTEKNGNTLTAVDGDLIYIPKDTEYVVQFFCPSGDVADLLVNFNAYDTSGNEYTFASEITRVFSDTPKSISDRMQAIAEQSISMNSPHLAVTEVFYGLMSRIISHSLSETQEDPKKRSVSKAIVYIDNHLNENTPVTELAKKCLMSETAFRKVFREITGTSPAKYKMLKKIQKAQSILQSSPEVSVNEVAYMLGFCDVSYFYKVFFEITGTTPKKIREL